MKSELLTYLRRNDLLRAVLLLGRVRDPGFCPERYVEKLLELAARVWHRCGRVKYDSVLKAQSINHVLFKSLGITGKTERYKNVIDDPEKILVSSLLDNRCGSPLNLTVLYMVLAEQVGLSVECVALPTYYYIKVNDTVTPFYIDAFDGGRFLTEEEFQRRVRSSMQKSRLMSQSLYEKLNAGQLVGRVVSQLKHVYILKGRALEALRAVELMTALYPRSPELTRDRGILYCEMEYFSKAMADLKSYLKQRPHADDVKEIKKLTSMLQGYREIMN